MFRTCFVCVCAQVHTVQPAVYACTVHLIGDLIITNQNQIVHALHHLAVVKQSLALPKVHVQLLLQLGLQFDHHLLNL